MNSGSPLLVSDSDRARFTPLFCQDIINCIIDCIDNELPPLRNEMLAACTLVCRDWVQQSQMRLLRNIHLHDFGRLEELITSLPELSERARLSIHSLSVYSATISTTQVIALVGTLPNLEMLQLSRVQLLSSYRKSEISTLRPLHNLSFTSVTNYTHDWHTIHDIITFTSLFQSIQHLKVNLDVSTTPTEQPTYRLRMAEKRTETDISYSLPASDLGRFGFSAFSVTNPFFWRFLQQPYYKDFFKTANLSTLDTDIIAQLELLLVNNSASLERLALTFSPIVIDRYQGNGELSG
ncbi:hypothetical protein EIP86_011166 [Pleurotus ostreatoroseus]|nr:hypothetical protein EIP86_011166 [Pleurotus ostreatoroseus]